MFRIQFTSLSKSEYQELWLCGHDIMPHGSLSRPYKAKPDRDTQMPE